MIFLMFKLVLEKAEESEIKLPTFAGSWKKQEFQKNIYFCFIDYDKAFDCVDHNKLWKILKEMGIPDHLICLLRNLYAGQEATDFSGATKVVGHSHLLKNFPQFIVIHTVKGIVIVNKAEIDVFLELSCFFHDPANVGNLISGSSAFSKTSLNIWKFTVHSIAEAWLREP